MSVIFYLDLPVSFECFEVFAVFDSANPLLNTFSPSGINASLSLNHELLVLRIKFLPIFVAQTFGQSTLTIFLDFIVMFHFFKSSKLSIPLVIESFKHIFGFLIILWVPEMTIDFFNTIVIFLHILVFFWFPICLLVFPYSLNSKFWINFEPPISIINITLFFVYIF